MLLRDIPQRRTAYLTQPEQKSANIRVAPQITKILRRHERSVVFSVDECPVVDRIRL
jgi:hypothetical protein